VSGRKTGHHTQSIGPLLWRVCPANSILIESSDTSTGPVNACQSPT
jgi:hypothetical protein